MQEEKIKVALGDLLSELAKLTNTNLDEMEINLEFLPNFIYGAHEKNEVLHKNIPEKLNLSVISNDVALNYTITSDLNEPQADGISLYDHTEVIQKHALKEKDVDWDITYIILPKESLKNIICTFDIKDFIDSQIYDERITEAIIDSAPKSKTQKTLKRR